MNRWIPTSKRLPEVGGEYLVAVSYGSIPVRCFTEFGYFCKVCGRFYQISDSEKHVWPECDQENIEEILPMNVVAWQNLPEPYQGK